MPTRIKIKTPRDDFQNICYSQLGEDQIVDHFFSNVKPIKNGFYVDVGCHHPQKFSNTYLLYIKGWRGLAIDADSNLSSLYSQLRPEDTFINSGVNDKDIELRYYIFENAAANTFDEKSKDDFLRKGWKIVGEKIINTKPLNEIVLSQNIPYINYLNIDIEGFDFLALNSFDFNKYTPELISIETNCRDLATISELSSAKLLASHGYYIYSHCVITTFFALK